jgi:CBS domain-containing protein
MDEHDFSQIPVVAGGTVIGVFTYRSLARNLRSIRRHDDPLDISVDDLLENLAFVRPGADVSDILRRIETDDAVLVGDDDHLLAVATAYDVTRFLWDATRPFILVRDIELAVRDLIRHACPSQPELQRRIAAALPAREDKDVGTTLEDLTLGELIGVLLQGENFGQCFKHTFGQNRDLVRGQMESARLIRNKVFHFAAEYPPRRWKALLISGVGSSARFL